MKAFDYSLVKDPQYFCDNRMEAHSDHVYYRDGNEMQTAVQDGTETSFRYSLNGLWKFHYARNYKSAVQGGGRIFLQGLGRYLCTGAYPDGRI